MTPEEKNQDDVIRTGSLATPAILLCELPAPIRHAWCKVRDEGGWWTVQELMDVVDFSPKKWSVMAQWLTILYARGNLVRKPLSTTQGQSLVFVYGVTPKCIPPDGLTLEPGP